MSSGDQRSRRTALVYFQARDFFECGEGKEIEFGSCAADPDRAVGVSHVNEMLGIVDAEGCDDSLLLRACDCVPKTDLRSSACILNLFIVCGHDFDQHILIEPNPAFKSLDLKARLSGNLPTRAPDLQAGVGNTMSHPMYHDSEDEDIVLKPKPRHPFELSSPPPSAPSTPPPANLSFSSSYLQPHAPSNNSNMDGSATPSRTRSFLNLTSSTLFGIYQPTGYSTERDEATTPWGTGAQTPAEQSPLSRQTTFDWSRARIPDTVLLNGANGKRLRRKSTAAHAQPYHKPRRGFKGYLLPLLARLAALAGVGVLYGLLITHLHDRQEIAPVKVEVNRSSWTYLALWGMAGVLFGEALPWLDHCWHSEDEDDEEPEDKQDRKVINGLEGWLHVVRSIGAFVGIAFAIRKLPWQSTLQLSLTLALANPAVWYLIDRSPTGFILSTIVALCGTAVLLGINPALVPSPTPAEVLRGHVERNGGRVNASAIAFGDDEFILGVFSQESVGVATWIASVLFVSSVCFGNIGRRLAPQKA